MTWNYRAVKTDEGFGVFEVYYNETGCPSGTAVRPVLNFCCETPEDLLHELEVIKAAWEQPPLELKFIGAGR